jgi:hypothetical protein
MMSPHPERPFLQLVMAVFQGEQSRGRQDRRRVRLWKVLRELDRHLSSHSAWLVNHAERHRADPRVGTALAEASTNSLINRRMNKSQQMRWSRRGTDLLQVRRATASLAPAPASCSKPIQPPVWPSGLAMAG